MVGHQPRTNGYHLHEEDDGPPIDPWNGVSDDVLNAAPQPEAEPQPETTTPTPKTYTLGELVQTRTQMREETIRGLLRVGESMNLIASPKTGKSWTVAGLAFAVATGRDWLGFGTVAGDVLIVDNELHLETLASRLRRVAEANQIDLRDVADRITVLPLRGRLTDLPRLGEYFRSQIPGRFRLVIVDAYYRTLPVGTDENDNGAVAGLYNLIDQYADHLRGSFVLVHHASKGDQSAKKVTDVGSGAGSQSRAADTHLVLRAHAEDDAIVLDAAVRSFPPVAPKCYRWRFPRFELAEDLDPADLRQATRGRRPKAAKPDEPETPPEQVWDAKRFADTFGTEEPKKRLVIIDQAVQAGISERRANTLLKTAVEAGFLFVNRCEGWGASFDISKKPFDVEKTKAKRSKKAKT